MSIVRDSNLFAIEWTNLDVCGSWILVDFCFWIKGKQVGEPSDSAVLLDIRAAFIDFLARSNERHAPALQGKSKEQLFAALYDKYIVRLDGSKNLNSFDSIGTTHSYQEEFEAIRNFHLVDCGGASFASHVDIFLLDDDIAGGQRILWRNWNNSSIFEEIFPFGLFNAVASMFLAQSGDEIARIRFDE